MHDNEIEAATGREKREALLAAMEDADSRGASIQKERESLTKSRDQLSDEIVRLTALQSDIQLSSETRTEDYKRLEDEYNKNAVQIETLRQP